MGAEAEIHQPEGILHPVTDLLLLGHAAAEDDHQLGVLPLLMDESAHVAEDAHFRVLTNGAGVDADHVRLLLLIGHGIAHVPEPAAKDLAVGLVLLAAVGIHQRIALLAVVETDANALADGLLFGNLGGADFFSYISHGHNLPVYSKGIS